MKKWARQHDYIKFVIIYSLDQSWANECLNIFVGPHIQQVNVRIHLVPKNPMNICKMNIFVQKHSHSNIQIFATHWHAVHALHVLIFHSCANCCVFSRVFFFKGFRFLCIFFAISP